MHAQAQHTLNICGTARAGNETKVAFIKNTADNLASNAYILHNIIRIHKNDIYIRKHSSNTSFVGIVVNAQAAGLCHAELSGGNADISSSAMLIDIELIRIHGST